MKTEPIGVTIETLSNDLSSIVDPTIKPTITDLLNLLETLYADNQQLRRKKPDNSAEEYLTKVKAMPPDALPKQCIPDDENLWKLANFEEFLESRRKALTTEFNQFLDGLVNQDQDNYGEITIEELISQVKVKS